MINLIKKIIYLSFSLLVLFSCNSKTNELAKVEKSIICIEEIGYHETKFTTAPPVLVFKIKVEDSAFLKRIEKGELRQVFLYSMGKEEQQYLNYEGWGKLFIQQKSFAINIRTGVFVESPDENFHKWTSEEIKKI